MKKIPEKISRIMVVFRTILLLGVIYNHTPDKYFVPNNSIQKLIFINVNHFIMNFVICAVPVYFIMSGYLLYKEDCTYIQLVKKKIFSLMIPYFLWNVFQIVLYVSAEILPMTRKFFTDTDNDFLNMSAVNIVSYVLGVGHNDFPVNGPMWYVRDLFVLIIISPLLKKILDKYSFLIITLFLFMMYNHTRIFFLRIDGPLFLSLGYLICKHEDVVIEFIKHLNLRVVTISFSILSIMVCYLNYNEYNMLSIFSAILLYLVIALKIQENSHMFYFFEKLSKYSFFVYGLHASVIIVVGKIFNKIFTWDNIVFDLIGYFLLFILSTIICYCVAYIVSSRCPKLFGLFNGMRNKYVCKVK